MTSKRKTKPFPWRCPKCLKREVHPVTVDHVAHAKYEGRPYRVTIPGFVVPRCPACGEQVFCNDTDEQINRALRNELGLLQPEEIRVRRKALHLTQRALADRIKVAQETISRWESGLLIQARAMDKLLRIFFDFSNVRDALDAELAGSRNPSSWIDWASLESTSVFVTSAKVPSAIFDEQAQTTIAADEAIAWQWAIVGESSYVSTTEDKTPAESQPRIAA